MTVSPRRLGAYAPLSATYAFDDAVMEAGEAAELLFVRALAFCASADSDGYITRAQLVRYVGAGMTDAIERAERLVEVGIFDSVDGGWVVRSWLRWNQSAEEKGRERRRDRERKAAARAAAKEEPPPESCESPGDVRPDTHRDSREVSGEESETLSGGQVAGIREAVQNGGSTSPCLDTEQDKTRTGQNKGRATRAPDHLLITDAMREWAASKGLRCDLDAETEQFLDHHRAKGSAFKDWVAAWRTWMSRADKYAPKQPATAGGRFFEQ